MGFETTRSTHCGRSPFALIAIPNAVSMMLYPNRDLFVKVCAVCVYFSSTRLEGRPAEAKEWLFIRGDGDPLFGVR